MAPVKRRPGRPPSAAKTAAPKPVRVEAPVAAPTGDTTVFELIEECAEHLQVLTTILQALPAAIAARLNGAVAPAPSLPPVDFSSMKRKALKEFVAAHNYDIDLDDYEELEEAQAIVSDAYYGPHRVSAQPATVAPARAVMPSVVKQPAADVDEGMMGSFDFDNMSLAQLKKFIIDHEMEADVDLDDDDLRGNISLQRVAVEEAYALLTDANEETEPDASASNDDEDSQDSWN